MMIPSSKMKEHSDMRHCNSLFRQLSEETMMKISLAFKQQIDFNMEDVEVYCQPFPHMILRHVIKDETLLSEARREVLTSAIHVKSSDLYQFQQTEGLLGRGVKKFDSSTISSSRQTLDILSEALYSEYWVNCIRKISGIDDLDQNPIDLSGQCYRKTDHLLCHDDRLEGRRLAFILYLVDEEWNEMDGGHLELFSVDDYGQPTKVSNRILPVFNSFVIFEVSTLSYHQVMEVLSSDKQRLSLSGWFHGPSPKNSLGHINFDEEGYKRSEILYQQSIRVMAHSSSCFMKDLLNLSYKQGYESSSVHPIRQVFQEQSSVQLDNWMTPTWLERLYHDIFNARWSSVGPANRRHYERYVEEEIRTEELSLSYLERTRRLWSSYEFLNWLEWITGLSWEPLTSEIRRLQPGDYTLLADLDDIISSNFDTDQETSHISHILDVIFFMDAAHTPQSDGSHEVDPSVIKTETFLETPLIYVSGKDPLLTIQPKSNSLVLIYREHDIHYFQKYITRLTETQSHHPCRIDFISSFVERKKLFT